MKTPLNSQSGHKATDQQNDEKTISEFKKEKTYMATAILWDSSSYLCCADNS